MLSARCMSQFVGNFARMRACLLYTSNYGADYFLQNVKDIFSTDDLSIANFEGTLTDSDEREDKTFAFKAPASYASILTGGSVEAVNTANNRCV